MNNQQIKTTQEMKLPHEQARDLFMSIQKQSGAAIKPIGVFQFFYNYITTISKSKMNRVKARNIADVYCALQNEFFITNGSKNPHEWFYMTQSRWDKYGLGRKAIQNSIKFLSENIFIETTLRTHPYIPQNKLRWYKLDLEWLKYIADYTENNNPKNWR